jgi:multidrug resistance efflux pump
VLELFLCSLLTIFPDYLYRRYAQGKRFVHEINLFSVWFELRWGIVSCVMLTIGLITVIFYFHPSTSSVTSFFRTVPIISETNGRVAEIFIRGSERIEKGAPIFRLDSSQQAAAVEVARRRIAETDAAIVVAQTDLLATDAQIQQARSALQQAVDELQTKEELNRRNSDIVARREIERLQVLVQGRQGGLDAANAAKQAVEAKLSTLLPAQKASPREF